LTLNQNGIADLRFQTGTPVLAESLSAKTEAAVEPQNGHDVELNATVTIEVPPDF
jgi:hypothetical protein